MERTLVKMYRSNTCIVVSTYSRRFGHHGRFLILHENFMDWLARNAGKTTFYDSDCGNYVSVRWREDTNTFLLRFSWLSENSLGEVHGVVENVELDGVNFLLAITRETPVALLSKDDAENAGKIVFRKSAMQTVGAMDAKTRRAFSKAMRQGALAWPNTQTEVFADGGANFFFSTGYGLCGGLILHAGSRDSVAYGVHT